MMNFHHNLGRPLFGFGGGYKGPSAAQLEDQARRDFERQRQLMQEQHDLAMEASEKQRLAAEEKAAAEMEKMQDAEKARKKAEELAAMNAAANAGDFNYDAASGSTMSLLRSGVQIPEGDSGEGAQ